MRADSKHHFSGILAVASICALAVGMADAPPALALPPSASCGETLTASVTLSEGITNCDGGGVIIGAENLVFNCEGHAITGSGGGIGIAVLLESNVTIVGCRVSGFGTGVVISNSSDVELRDSVVTASAGFGIQANYTIFGSFLSNALSGNLGGGMALSDSSLSTFSANTVVGNGAGRSCSECGAGLLFTGSGAESCNHDVISGNFVDNNRGDGVSVLCGGDLTVSENIAADNGLNGILLGASVAPTASFVAVRNAAEGNKGAGYDFEGAANYLVSDNIAAANLGDGFVVNGATSESSIIGNAAMSNRRNGFEVNASAPFGFLENHATKNLADGFLIQPLNVDGGLYSNFAYGNVAFGFEDLSSGSGTSGTADMYSGNICKSDGFGGSFPGGLCEPPPTA